MHQQAAPSPTLSHGYASGGHPRLAVTYIQKFPFASDDNASIVGNLDSGSNQGTGHSSTVSGYTSGGDPSPTGIIGAIQKFPFATNNDATNVGNLAIPTYGSGAMSSANDGYVAGGNIPGSPGKSNDMQKFSFANEALTSILPPSLFTGMTADLMGNSSAEHGYTVGGVGTESYLLFDSIAKIPFAGDYQTSNVGDLTAAKTVASTQDSSTHGYVSGGWLWPGSSDVIEKFSFSSNGNSTDVGDLAIGTNGACGNSSSDSGYSTGGYNASSKAIQKFSFATDGNAANSAELTENASSSTGQQG